jgi:hypothetical protein
MGWRRDTRIARSMLNPLSLVIGPRGVNLSCAA